MICVTGAQWVSLTRAGIAGFASKLLGARVEEADLDEDWNELLGSDKRDVRSMSRESSCPSPAVQYTPESSPPCKRVRINSAPIVNTIERNETDEGNSDGDSDDIPVIAAVVPTGFGEKGWMEKHGLLYGGDDPNSWTKKRGALEGGEKSGNMDEMEPDTNANDGLTRVQRLHAYAESQEFDGKIFPER